ncbi:MAG: sulfatase [Gemmataceae bacterium]
MTRCIVLLVLAGLVSPAPLAAQAKRPNIVLVVADDLGLDLPCYGNKAIKMPNLEALAKRGIRFSKAYTSVSSCSPSRASLYSGLYTHQNGQYGLAHPPHSQHIHPWVQGLPNLLATAGYFTGIIGKFHVIPTKNFSFELELTKVNPRSPVSMATGARDFLKKRGAQPFFLVYGFTDPHRAKKGFANEGFEKDPAETRYKPKDVIVPPFLPDRPEVRAELAEYYQSASRMDRGVGELMKALAEAGVLEETLIIFVSDNGIPFPGAKTTLYEAGTHLPLLIAGPGVPAGRTNNALVSFVDLTPTLLEIGKASPPKYKLPGRSLVPIFKDDNPKGWDEVFGSHQFHEITMYYPMRSLTTSKFKYIVNLDNAKEFPFSSDLWGSTTWQSVRKNSLEWMGGRRVFTYMKRPREELFDLTKDPNEFKNVAADPDYGDVLTKMRGRVQEWQRETSDPWIILGREENPDLNR